MEARSLGEVQFQQDTSTPLYGPAKND